MIFLLNMNQLCGPLLFEHVWTQFGRETLTCTDSDSADKLFSPAAAAHHQRQVSLLYELVDGILKTHTNTYIKDKSNLNPQNCILVVDKI